MRIKLTFGPKAGEIIEVSKESGECIIARNKGVLAGKPKKNNKKASNYDLKPAVPGQADGE
jgi:hypothetical protein